MVEVIERHPGGSMSGIFGAGYLFYAEKHPEFRQIVKPKLFDCSSSGGINVPFALAGQVAQGIKIYTDYLPGNFLFPGKIIPGIAQRAWNRFVYETGIPGLKEIPRDKLKMPVDIDFLFHIIENEVGLDIARIEKSETPANVRIYNPFTAKTSHMDLRKDTLNRMRGTAGIIPYYFPSNLTEVDLDMRETIGLDSLLEMYPDDRIIIILNHKPMRYPYHYLFQFIEGGVASLMVPGNSLGVWNDFNHKAQRFMKDINRLREMENNGESALIYPRKEPLPRDARDRKIFWVHPSERSKTKANTCGKEHKRALEERAFDGERAAEAVYNLFK